MKLDDESLFQMVYFPLMSWWGKQARTKEEAADAAKAILKYFKLCKVQVEARKTDLHKTP